MQIAASKELKSDGSGNVTISFVKKEEKYSFNFENRKGGLILNTGPVPTSVGVLLR